MKKCAFSDGVSVNSRPWYKVIQDYIDQIYDDTSYQEKKISINLIVHIVKNHFIIEKYLKNIMGNMIMLYLFWVHPFSDQMEPSAWTLDEEENMVENSHITEQSRNIPS